MNLKRSTFIIMMVFPILISLACSTINSLVFTPTPTLTATAVPAATETSPADEDSLEMIIYDTGIEVFRAGEVPGIVDHSYHYGMTFPEDWIIGPLHADFAPLVKENSQVNNQVEGLFNFFSDTDPDVRLFGFSTLPSQLNEESFLVMTGKVFTDDRYLSQSIDELADRFIDNQPGKELVKFTSRSKALASAFDIPVILLLDEVQDANGKTQIYNGILLAKLDSTYVQVFFMTNNPEINLGEELAFPASSITNFPE